METKLIFINIANSEKIMHADYQGKHFEVKLPPFSSQILDY